MTRWPRKQLLINTKLSTQRRRDWRAFTVLYITWAKEKKQYTWIYKRNSAGDQTDFFQCYKDRNEISNVHVAVVLRILLPSPTAQLFGAPSIDFDRQWVRSLCAALLQSFVVLLQQTRYLFNWKIHSCRDHSIKSNFPFLYRERCELTAGSDEKTAQPRRGSNLGLLIAGRTLWPLILLEI